VERLTEERDLLARQKRHYETELAAREQEALEVRGVLLVSSFVTYNERVVIQAGRAAASARLELSSQLAAAQDAATAREAALSAARAEAAALRSSLESSVAAAREAAEAALRTKDGLERQACSVPS
jgi:hypothetical protein